MALDIFSFAIFYENQNLFRRTHFLLVSRGKANLSGLSPCHCHWVATGVLFWAQSPVELWKQQTLLFPGTGSAGLQGACPLSQCLSRNSIRPGEALLRDSGGTLPTLPEVTLPRRRLCSQRGTICTATWPASRPPAAGNSSRPCYLVLAC